RFGPGFGVIAKTALDNLVTINDQAGKAAKTVVIVHEDSAFGAGLAKLLNAQLPARGFQVVETMSHPTPTRDFNNIVLTIKKQVEAKGAFFTYEVYMNYSCVLLLADAIERAKSTDRAKIIEALASS